MRRSRVGWQMQLAMSETPDAQWNLQECIIFHAFPKTSHNFQGFPYGIVKLWKFGVHSLLPSRKTAPVDGMMTSSNGNIFRVTGPLSGDFTILRWISRT